MGGPSIRTVNLTKRFGRFTALDSLSLDLEGSKCVGFLGPNGAGKTTTLKMLADMIFPTKGEAYLNGIQVRSDRKKALDDVGVLIETPEIYGSLSPREALRMVADLRGVPGAEQRTRIPQVLEEVRMGEWADAKIAKFSKGMKQRINIAAALVHDPKVVILDEPTTGLDPRGMAEVRSIVRELKRQNRLVFMSSHILSEVQDVCDEVAFVNRGKLLFYDTLARLTAAADGQPNTTFDVAFRRPITDQELDGQVRKLSTLASVDRLGVDRIRVRLAPSSEGTEPFLAQLLGLKLGIASFAESENALEQTYLRLIERGDG